MEKLPDNLDQIDSLIKITSEKIDALKRNIQGLEQHIAINKNLEKQFKQNLDTLKDVNIISIASEFKKIKQNLVAASGNIVTSSIDLNNNLVFLQRAEKLLADLNEKYDTIIESHKSNIIIGRFRNKLWGPMEAKDVKYILYIDSNNDDEYQLGFNRYNKPGYIDDGSGWDENERDEEFFEKVLSKLHDYVDMSESYTFSYAVHTLPGLEEKLKELGITRQEQAWEEWNF